MPTYIFIVSDSKIKPSIIDSANSYIMEITTKMDSVVKYADRLKVVRIEKANKPKFQEFGSQTLFTHNILY